MLHSTAYSDLCTEQRGGRGCRLCLQDLVSMHPAGLCRGSVVSAEVPSCDDSPVADNALARVEEFLSAKKDGVVTHPTISWKRCAGKRLRFISHVQDEAQPADARWQPSRSGDIAEVLSTIKG